MGTLYRSGSWPLPRLDLTGNDGEQRMGRDLSKFAKLTIPLCITEPQLDLQVP